MGLNMAKNNSMGFKKKKKNRLGQIWAQPVKRGPRGPVGWVWAPEKKKKPD